MKKILALLCSVAAITTLSGCNKRDTLQIGGDTPQSVEFSAPSTPSEILEDLELQKISDLRGDIDRQIERIKSADYKNLHVLDNFTVKLPDSDVLYELELSHPEFAFHDFYDKFDRVFDREFGDIYSEEDKAKIYIATAADDDFYADDYAQIPLAERIDKFESGELELSWLFVNTNKAYLEMYSFSSGIFRLYRDGTIKRAEPDKEPTRVIFTAPEDYFTILKDSLDVDSDEKYALLDKEMSVKEAAEEVKRLVAEREYSWGGGLDPDVHQVRVIDIGEGKYGLEFMLAPSYKGVLFDVRDKSTATAAGIPEDKENHNYNRSPTEAFMMESGKIESLLVGDSAYEVTEIAEHNSVIPLDKAVEIASEKFGMGMKLSLGRAELIYSPMYYKQENRDNMGAFPIWKLKCSNAVDGWKYIVYVNAVTGEFEFYVTEGWVVE